MSESVSQSCEAPASNGSLEQPVIYGEARWMSPEAAAELLSPAEARGVAAEVAILGVGSQTGVAGAALGESSLLCDGEPMADEVALAKCSGMLIAPDLMVTAKHCTEIVSCDEMFVTRDFDTPLHPGDSWAFELRHCVRVLASDPVLDTAIVELAPTADRAIPVVALRLEPIADTTGVMLISHPLGTSTKVDMDAAARPSGRDLSHMWLRGDAFTGSSGAGVIDTDGRLVGIVTAGLSDFSYDHEAGCMRVVRSDSKGFERLSSVASVLRAACEVIPEHFLCNERFSPRAAESDESKPDRFEPEQRMQIGCE